MERPPVRPTTPPQLRLLELGSRREREDFAAEVNSEDKEGAINDARALEREEARWRTAEQTSLMLELQRVHDRRFSSETSRSQPQSRAGSPYTYTPAIQRIKSARGSLQRGWFSSHSNTIHVGQGAMGQPEHRAAYFTKGITPVQPDDQPEEECQTFFTATNIEEPRLTRPTREVTHSDKIPSKQPAAEVGSLMKQSLDRWQARPPPDIQTSKQMRHYVNIDTASNERMMDETEKAQRMADVLAYYSQSGLPFIAKTDTDVLRDRLALHNEELRTRKLKLGQRIRQSQSSSTPEASLLRSSITAAICEDNKMVKKDDYITGRTVYLPSSAAASAVSDPSPLSWEATPIPWVMDPQAGEWVRLDMEQRPPPWVVRNPKSKPNSAVHEHANNGIGSPRTIVNKVEFPKPSVPIHPQSAVPTVPRATINMGGGFVYRSDIQVDPARPTPSRPAYSRGLFLFPFSNEEASRLMGGAVSPVDEGGRRPFTSGPSYGRRVSTALQRARLDRIVPSRYSSRPAT